MTLSLTAEETGAEARYHHGDLRGALIAAGRSVLEEAGPKALTLREAARRANVSHAAPRHHFPSLRHFLGDCAADGFAEFDAALCAAAATEADPALALAAMGRAYLRFATAHRAMFRLMFDKDTFTEHTDALLAASGRAHATLVAGVTALAGSIDGEELGYRVASVWSIVHGYANLALEGQICRDPGPQADPGDMAARAVLDYLKGALGAQ